MPHVTEYDGTARTARDSFSSFRAFRTFQAGGVREAGAPYPVQEPRDAVTVQHGDLRASRILGRMMDHGSTPPGSVSPPPYASASGGSDAAVGGGGGGGSGSCGAGGGGRGRRGGTARHEGWRGCGGSGLDASSSPPRGDDTVKAGDVVRPRRSSRGLGDGQGGALASAPTGESMSPPPPSSLSSTPGSRTSHWRTMGPCRRGLGAVPGPWRPYWRGEEGAEEAGEEGRLECASGEEEGPAKRKRSHPR